MNQSQKKEVAVIVQNLKAYAEQLLTLQEFEEIALNDLSAEVNARYAERLEENAAVLDEAAFFIAQAIENLKEIPGIEDLLEE